MGSTWLEGYDRPHRHPGSPPLCGWLGHGVGEPDDRLGRGARPAPLPTSPGLERAVVRGPSDSHRPPRADSVDTGRELPARTWVALRPLRTGLGSIRINTMELLGHTGYVGAFAFYEPESGATLTGTHNALGVSRWPLVEVLASSYALGSTKRHEVRRRSSRSPQLGHLEAEHHPALVCSAMWQCAIQWPGLVTSSRMSTVCPAGTRTVSFQTRLGSARRPVTGSGSGRLRGCGRDGASGDRVHFVDEPDLHPVPTVKPSRSRGSRPRFRGR